MFNYEELDKEISDRKDLIKPFIKEYNNIQKQLRANRGKPATEEVKQGRIRLQELDLEFKKHNWVIASIHGRYN